MANFEDRTEEGVQEGEEFVDLTSDSIDVDEGTPKDEPNKAEKKSEEEELPEKYRGKSPAEIAKMHRELEALLGRQAQEVGELRKLTDAILQQQLAPKTEPAAKEDAEDVDFYLDPEKAVQKLVEKHPDVEASRTMREEIRRERVQQQLAAKHPDFSEIVADPRFQKWVMGSPVRQRLFQEAHNYNLDAANELFDTFKALHPKQAESEAVQADTAALQANQAQALKDATVDGGGAGQVGKKIYRRQDLIRLRIENPQRYEAMEPEIRRAYAEKRVK